MVDPVDLNPKSVPHWSPYDFLRDMARIDATLTLRFKAGTFGVNYVYPDQHEARCLVLRKTLDNMNDAWRAEYFRTIFELLHIDPDLPQYKDKTDIEWSIDLASSFVLSWPATGLEAGKLIMDFCDQLNDTPWKPNEIVFKRALANQKIDLVRYIKITPDADYQLECYEEIKRREARDIEAQSKKP